MSDFVFIQDRSYAVEAFKSALCEEGYSVDVIPLSHIYKWSLPNILEIYNIIKNSFIITSAVFVSPSILALLNKIKLVSNGYVIRMCGDPLIELRTRGFFKYNIETITVNFGLKNASAIFYVAKYLQKIYEQKFPNLNHKTIYNGIDMNIFSPKMGDKQLFDYYITKKSNENNELNAVCVMNFNIELKMRYLPIFAKILQKIERKYDINFFFIGGGVYFTKCQLIFKDCKNVYFLGKLSRRTLSRILPLFDFFFYPTSLDVLPNVLLEASASGLACLSTYVGGIPEIVIHEKTGLLSISSDNFYNYLKILIEDSNLRKTFGRAARKWMEKNFSENIVGQHFVKELFSSLNTKGSLNLY